MKKGIDLIVDIDIEGESLRFAFDFKAYSKYLELNPPTFKEPKGLDELARIQFNNVCGGQLFLYILKATLWSGMDYEMTDEEVYELRRSLGEDDYKKLADYWVFMVSGRSIDQDESKKKGLSFAKKIKMRATN